MNEVVLVVVAHPDDESISMAGTIAKHVRNGDEVIVMAMTDGVGAREDAGLTDIDERRNACFEASEALGFEWGEFHNFKDNAMDSYPLIEVVKAIEKAKSAYSPTLVYTHSGSDLNVDHRVVANAVLTAFRPQPQEKCRELRLFEVASATDYGHRAITGTFSPNLFVNISKEWPSKARALEAYSSEMREYPHSRSIEGIMNLAKLRGNQVGCELAEAFEIIRRLEN